MVFEYNRKYYCKITRIMLEYFYDEIKHDIFSTTKSIFSISTYKKLIGELLQFVFGLFMKPKNQVNWATLFVLLTLLLYLLGKVKLQLLILFIAVWLLLYLRKIWISGNPIEFQKKRYFEP